MTASCISASKLRHKKRGFEPQAIERNQKERDKTRNHFYCCIRLLIGDHLGFVKLISRDICKLMAT